MLSSIEQAFVGRDEKRASLKKPAWEAISVEAFDTVQKESRRQDRITEIKREMAP